MPGRTITVSEFERVVKSCKTDDYTVPPHTFAARLGITVVPDPEPTNVERLRKEIGIAWGARENPDGYDSVFDSLASRLDAAGVKAPGVDDA